MSTIIGLVSTFRLPLHTIMKAAVYILYMYGNCGMKCLYETDVFYKIGSYFHLCFTFTAQIMHRIPILMSYFVDHYARLLVS